MKKTRLSLIEASQLFPSFLKTHYIKQKLKNLNRLLYGKPSPKYRFVNKKRISLPIDLRKSHCYRGISWYVWMNGINHRKICGKKKKKIYVFLCMNTQCSEKFIDVAEKHSLHYFCSKCKVKEDTMNHTIDSID